MKKFFNICFAVILLAIIAASVYFGGKTTLTAGDYTFSILNSDLAVIIVGLLLVMYAIAKIKRKISSLKHNKNSPEAISNDIQQMLSFLLLKDVESSEKQLEKIKRVLKDSPITNWFDGNIELLKNNTHKAKSLFYLASASERNSSLGVYSICRLAVQSKDKVTEVETLNTILESSGYQESVLMRLLVIYMLNNDFINAHECMHKIQSHNRNDRLEAILKFVESQSGSLNEDVLLKSAFDLAPDITAIALAYANYINTNQGPKKAKSVLEKTWKLCPHPDVFNAYIQLDDDLIAQIDAGYDLVASQTNTWIGYYEYAKLLLDCGKIEDAFHNLLGAYGKSRLRLVYDLLYRVSSMLPDPKPSAALEILSKNHESEVLDKEFGWGCSSCGMQHVKWNAICKQCESIDSVHWGVEHRHNINNSLISL